MIGKMPTTKKAPVAAASVSTDEQAVMNAMTQYAEAMGKRDAKTLDALYLDTLMYAHSNCFLENKKQAIANVVDGEGSYKVKLKKQKVQVFGKTAVVRGDVTITVTKGTEKTDNHLNVLYAWVKQGGKWRMAARQATRYPAKP